MKQIILLVFVISFGLAQNASITINCDQELGSVNTKLLGTNIVNDLNADYILSSNFLSRINALKDAPVRWPGGNNACIYNWKIDGDFRDTLGSEYGMDIMEIAKFCDYTGMDLQITVNFGTMNAADAADLVEFCNGPITSEWGHVRDSLGHPEPFNVKYWEIGNEMGGSHMWQFAWTAQNAWKYFFGGSEQRRGMLPPGPDGPPFKGDFVQSDGSANQEFLIRFPDVWIGTDSVRVGPDTSNFEMWTRVDDLDSVGLGNYYEMDFTNSVLKFGDGTHGNIPSSGDHILCEYITINHDGYVEFVDSMKAIDPAILTGACMWPPTAWSAETLALVYQRIDFDILHPYRHEDTTEDDTTSINYYYLRMTQPTKVAESIRNSRQNIDTVAANANNIEIAITEWNWILWNGSTDTPPANASLASGIFTADVLGRLISLSGEMKLNVGNYFLAGNSYPGNYLAYIGDDFRCRPAYYAFEIFSNYFGTRLVDINIDSDFYVIDNDTVPIITAYASKTEVGDSLFLIVINKHDSLDYVIPVEINGLEPESIAFVHTLNGAGIYATNEEDSLAITIRDSVIANASENFIYTFPCHSITAMNFSTTSNFLPQDSGFFVLPNPARGTMNIHYNLSMYDADQAKLVIYNVLGRKIKQFDNLANEPSNQVIWQGDDEQGYEVAQGTYFIILEASDQRETAKSIFLR